MITKEKSVSMTKVEIKISVPMFNLVLYLYLNSWNLINTTEVYIKIII